MSIHIHGAIHEKLVPRCIGQGSPIVGHRQHSNRLQGCKKKCLASAAGSRETDAPVSTRKLQRPMFGRVKTAVKVTAEPVAASTGCTTRLTGLWKVMSCQTRGIPWLYACLARHTKSGTNARLLQRKCVRGISFDASRCETVEDC